MWLNLVVAFVINVAAYMIQASSMPKPRDVKAKKFEVPVARDGHVPPVVFGTLLIKETNIIGYWAPNTKPIYSEGGGGKK